MDQIVAAQEAAIERRANETALSRVQIARNYLRGVSFLLVSSHAKRSSLCSCDLLEGGSWRIGLARSSELECAARNEVL